MKEERHEQLHPFVLGDWVSPSTLTPRPLCTARLWRSDLIRFRGWIIFLRKHIRVPSSFRKANCAGGSRPTRSLTRRGFCHRRRGWLKQWQQQHLIWVSSCQCGMRHDCSVSAVCSFTLGNCWHSFCVQPFFFLSLKSSSLIRSACVHVYNFLFTFEIYSVTPCLPPTSW